MKNSFFRQFIRIIKIFFFKQKGKNVKISFFAAIKHRHKISIGSHVTVKEFSKINGEGAGITVGDHCYIDRNVLISAHGGSISFGNNCSVNPNCCIYGHGGLVVGDYVRIAAGVVIVPHNHGFSRIDKPICFQEHTKKGIRIDDDVWIGANCVILDGVTIGKGTIIGAGSIVTKSLPAYSVAVGVPAKVIKKRT